MSIHLISCLRSHRQLSCYLLVLLAVIGLHRLFLQLPPADLQVPEELLEMVDPAMRDDEPSAIHVMQMVLGPRATRFQTVFLKSLFEHHFAANGSGAAPIHLHLLTDNATRAILEGLLGSWRIDDLRASFYPAEPIYAKTGWMKSLHYASGVATMKMYVPEILGSRVSKVVLLDTDTVLLTDINRLWQHFGNFTRHQFLGMAQEQTPTYFNFRKFRGPRVGFGYNAGVMLWYVERLPQDKWDAMWQSTFDRVRKVSPYFTAAEQTLINAVIVENPAIIYTLPCTWNMQMYEMANPKACKSTWNTPEEEKPSPPLLLHADRKDKRENEFFVNGSRWNGDVISRYIVLRSRYHTLDSYNFRRTPTRTPQFDMREPMGKLHPGGREVTSDDLCRTGRESFQDWCWKKRQLTFGLQQRIHPLYLAEEYKMVAANATGVTLAIGIDFDRLAELEKAARRWDDFISVAVHATDYEAHQLLSAIEKSPSLRHRRNIYYHIVHRLPLFPATVALHNTAVTYAPTSHVFLPSDLGTNLVSAKRLVSSLPAPSSANSAVAILTSPFPKDCRTNSGADVVCALPFDLISSPKTVELGQLQALVIPTKDALLPNEISVAMGQGAHLMVLLAKLVRR